MRRLFMLPVTMLTTITFCYTTHAQDYFYNNHYYANNWNIELGLNGGAMNCLTDLGGRKEVGWMRDVNWQHSAFTGGLFLSAGWQYKIGIRLEANFGRVSACDNILKNDPAVTPARYQRNLHFISSVAELLLTTEIHPVCLLVQDNAGKIAPYLLAGIGIFHFNPKAKWNNQWIELHPLKTEGQGFVRNRSSYKLTQVNFPMGAGLRYEANALLNLRIEFVYRLLQTDYLDDVSITYINPELFQHYLPQDRALLAKKIADRQGEINPSHQTIPGSIRGNPENNDAYFSFNLKIGLVINRERRQ